MKLSEIGAHLNEKVRGPFLGQAPARLLDKFRKHVTEVLDRDFTMPKLNSGISHIEVDKDFVVRKVHSSSTGVCFGGICFLNESFIDILKRVTDKNARRRNLSSFKKMMVRSRDLNTYQEDNFLEVCVIDAGGRESIRFIHCDIKKSARFVENGLWVIGFRDVSKKVWSSRQLRKPEPKIQFETNAVTNLLRFEKDIVQDFLASSVLSLKEVVDILSAPSSKYKNNKKRVELVFCIAHKIKGDAATLGLYKVRDKTHLFEDCLSELNTRKNPDRTDLLRLKKPLQEIANSVKEIKIIFERVVSGGWAKCNKDNGGSDTPLMSQVKYLVKNLASENKKRVVIVDSDYREDLIPVRFRRLSGQLLAQLVGNAVIHGIEDVGARLKAMKTPYGCIHVSVRVLKNYFILKVRDDGKGVDPELIRGAVLKAGMFDKRQVSAWNDTQLLNVLFRSGFSTSKYITKSAGRGVGLNMVKSTVEQHKGKISVNSVVGVFTEFTIAFPYTMTAAYTA